VNTHVPCGYFSGGRGSWVRFHRLGYGAKEKTIASRDPAMQAIAVFFNARSGHYREFFGDGGRARDASENARVHHVSLILGNLGEYEGSALAAAGAKARITLRL